MGDPLEDLRRLPSKEKMSSEGVDVCRRAACEIVLLRRRLNALEAEQCRPWPTDRNGHLVPMYLVPVAAAEAAGRA